jgi:signal transduction histidine kinase
MRLVQRAALSLTRALGPARRRSFPTGGDGNGSLRRAPLIGWLRSAISPDPIGRRPSRRLTWPLRFLLLASVTVPLLLLAIAAWQNLRLVQVQAGQRVTIETGQLHEHALTALETYALVLAWIDDRIRGLDWDRIQHDDGLQQFLSGIGALPQIGAVLIIDGSGRIRASDRPLAATPADASDREAFVAQRERNAGIFIGRQPVVEPTQPSFDISRRRSMADGSFDGVIVVSARPTYFGDFFSTVSRHEHSSASLVRSDGTVLMRYPSLPAPLVFNANRPIMKAIASQPDRGLFWGSGGIDGIERLFGYQRVGGYPLYVAFGIPAGGVLASWRGNLIDYLLFAAPASLGLLGITLFAVRQLQRQRVASWRWRTTAQRLKREMDRRTRAEAELHQAQRMEALGQLTGGVAHDFNNLLTVLQGCLEMLSGHQQDPKLQRRVEMALATIARGEKLIGQLLAFARRQPLKAARVDINDLLGRMTELLVQTVGRDVRISSSLSADLWPVDIDAAQFELCVLNLAINARDAMPTGGVLRLRTFNAPMLPGQSNDEGLSEGGNFVGVEIADTGTGMPPDVVARAFEPFFTSKGPGKGTGLGLSIVYGFVRQSGGSAAIRSEVGRGTAVTLLLPRSQDSGEANGRGATDLPPASAA